MSDLAKDDGTRSLPMEGLCHQDLEKLEDEVLERFTGKAKHPKTQHHHHPKTKKSYQGADSVRTSV